jgi:hypothetical protein
MCRQYHAQLVKARKAVPASIAHNLYDAGQSRTRDPTAAIDMNDVCLSLRHAKVRSGPHTDYGPSADRSATDWARRGKDP